MDFECSALILVVLLLCQNANYIEGQGSATFLSPLVTNRLPKPNPPATSCLALTIIQSKVTDWRVFIWLLGMHISRVRLFLACPWVKFWAPSRTLPFQLDCAYWVKQCWCGLRLQDGIQRAIYK